MKKSPLVKFETYQKWFVLICQECLGLIFHNENTTDGINQAMHQIHSYVPQHSSQGKTVFNKVGVVGDQLSVERAVNCLASLANGFTPDERLDGLHLEIADWHAELKFLSVSSSLHVSSLYSQICRQYYFFMWYMECLLFPSTGLLLVWLKRIESTLSLVWQCKRHFVTSHCNLKVDFGQ